MDQREVWNELAPEWRRLRTRAEEDVSNFLSETRGLILDAGCGTGRNLLAGRQYVALDFAERQLMFAKEKAEKEGIDAAFTVSSAERMPFRDDTFDAVILANVIHTMKKDEREKAMNETFRVMKPGAKVFVSVWNKRQPRFFSGPKEDYIPWKTGGGQIMRYYYFFTKGELGDLLERHGLKVLKICGSRKKALKLFPKDIIAIAEKAGVPKSGPTLFDSREKR